MMVKNSDILFLKGIFLKSLWEIYSMKSVEWLKVKNHFIKILFNLIMIYLLEGKEK